MDEDYDELMGPRPGQDMRKVFKDDPSPLPQDSIRRTSSSNSGPPPTLFHSMPDRWAQEEQHMNDAERRQATGRKDIMSFDEEEEERLPKDASPQGIRQEALRMLEVADSGTYSVHRTVTGGFMAEPRPMGNGKRVPTALAGLGSFAKGSARSSKPRVPSVYRDTPMEENYGYGDEYDSRFASQQVKEEKKESSSTWSSRYSVDDTLLAMSGGTAKTSKKKTSAFLDKLDSQNERRSARNMFMASPAKDASIFGAGFNFRQNNIFGKQGATTSDSNLRTVWMDAGASNSPARSWMDDLKSKQNKRRNYMIVAALFCAFVVTLVAVLARNGSSDAKSSVAKLGPNGEEAVMFYVTSDTPFNELEDQALANALTQMGHADFLVHLGSIQDSEVTQCAAEQYQKVADILWESPIPVFVLPGKEDWNNCPDQSAGWFNWVDNFMRYDEYFDYDFTIMRQEGYQENFAFIDGDVLFIGVHETDGRIDDMQELAQRNAANVAWIDGIANTYGDDVRAMVILANGRPFRTENNDFYLPLANVLSQFRPMPVAYIHSNDDDGDNTVTYQPYQADELDHVVAIQSSRGGAYAPLRIRVGWDEVNPFIVG